MHVGATKTDVREAAVTVIPVLKKILAKYKQDFPKAGDGWMFRGERLLRPLDLDKLSRRDIPQHINGAWFGWHAFRRGLGTRLNENGRTRQRHLVDLAPRRHQHDASLLYFAEHRTRKSRT